MAWKFQCAFVLVDDLALEKSPGKVMFCPNKASKDEIFWQLPASAVQRLGKAEMSNFDEITPDLPNILRKVTRAFHGTWPSINGNVSGTYAKLFKKTSTTWAKGRMFMSPFRCKTSSMVKQNKWQA